MLIKICAKQQKNKIFMNFHFSKLDNITNNNLRNNPCKTNKQINSTDVNYILSLSSSSSIRINKKQQETWVQLPQHYIRQFQRG